MEHASQGVAAGQRDLVGGVTQIAAELAPSAGTRKPGVAGPNAKAGGIGIIAHPAVALLQAARDAAACGREILQPFAQAFAVIVAEASKPLDVGLEACRQARAVAKPAGGDNAGVGLGIGVQREIEPACSD